MVFLGWLRVLESWSMLGPLCRRVSLIGINLQLGNKAQQNCCFEGCRCGVHLYELLTNLVAFDYIKLYLNTELMGVQHLQHVKK